MQSQTEKNCEVVKLNLKVHSVHTVLDTEPPQMKGGVVKGDPRRLTCYKHDKPGPALKKFLLFFRYQRAGKERVLVDLRGQIALEAHRCRAPAEVCMLRCKKKEVREVRLQGRRVK